MEKVGDNLSLAFGLLIAFAAPGFVLLWGVAPFSSLVSGWLGAASSGQGSSTSGSGFLFALLASVSAGVLVSGVRQSVMDPIIWATGVGPSPTRDESRLSEEGVSLAISQAVTDFYRYHQFYGNMAVAVALTYAAWLIDSSEWPWANLWILAGWLITEVLLFSSARHSIVRYYKVEKDLLG